MVHQPLECVCFTFIVDDIVLPCGTTCMEQLGGGGSQTLFGFQLVHSALHGGQYARLGLAAGVGSDVPASCLQQLQGLSCDMEGLLRHDRPTPRAWQVFESDGRRTQVWRTKGDPCEELYRMLQPSFKHLPERYQRHGVNYHMGVHPLHPPLELLKALRSAAHASGGVLSIETYTAAERRATDSEVQVLLSACDVFSPNQAEAESMVGPGQPRELAARLLAAAGPGGAGAVVVRCAEQGVVAQLADGGPTCMVPAVSGTHLVDVTGAGNAFCGGFLAALHAYGPSSPLHKAVRQQAYPSYTPTTPQVQGSGTPDQDQALDAAQTGYAGASAMAPGQGEQAQWAGADDTAAALANAAAWGCVAASAMIEETGVPRTPLPQLQSRARDRHVALLQRAEWNAGSAGAGQAEQRGHAVAATAVCAQPRRLHGMHGRMWGGRLHGCNKLGGAPRAGTAVGVRVWPW